MTVKLPQEHLRNLLVTHPEPNDIKAFRALIRLIAPYSHTTLTLTYTNPNPH